MADEFRDCFVVNFSIEFYLIFFSIYFQGEKGYDALKKLMRSGNDFCTDVAKCLQER
jgi:hypothetical protein